MSVTGAFAAVFEPITLLALVLGLALGVILGSIPGIGGVLGMAILLPLTGPLDGITAVTLLVSIYVGSLYGGAISAILLNIPGTSAAVASTFDGNPLSKQGRATFALAVSAIGSSIGGFLSALFLIIITPHLVQIVLLVNTPEYALIAVLGLAVLPLVVRKSQLRGFFAAAFGLLVTTVGIAPNSVVVRYGFGFDQLYRGFSYVAILIGLFAVSEMVMLYGMGREQIAQDGEQETKSAFASIRDGAMHVVRHPILVLKSTLIGMTVGSIPGTGASISNILSYGEAVRSSDDPDSFGEGNPDGVIASEVANNATAAGSLVPVLSFGIPGGAAAAVILGGMILNGIVPGPRLFTSQIELTQTIFASVAVGSLFILVIGTVGIVHVGAITRVNKDYIIPLVVVFAVAGSYSLSIRYIDVFTVLFAGWIGYLFRKLNYPVVALLLGAILGGIIEKNLLRSLSISGGSWDIFIEDPLSIVLVISIVLVSLGPPIVTLMRQSIQFIREETA
jgi:putative tricarboxylic transport membrane protein